MPLFFITTDDGDHRHIDDIGSELAGPTEARQAALDALPDMAREKMPDGDQRVFSVTVHDETHEVVYQASLTLKGEWGPRR